jgi:hypothetical protein
MHKKSEPAPARAGTQNGKIPQTSSKYPLIKVSPTLLEDDITECQQRTTSTRGNKIVWLNGPEGYHYFRQIEFTIYRNERPVNLEWIVNNCPRINHINAYEKPLPWKKIDGDMQTIHAWYLRNYDYDCDPEGNYKFAAPGEAIFPYLVGWVPGSTCGECYTLDNPQNKIPHWVMTRRKYGDGNFGYCYDAIHYRADHAHTPGQYNHMKSIEMDLENALRAYKSTHKGEWLDPTMWDLGLEPSGWDIQ